MLVCGRPGTLLFFISFLSFSFVSSSSSSSQNSSLPRSPLSGDDYENLFDDTTTVSLSSSSTYSEVPERNPCDYDMCVEYQQTCPELAAVENCLCPGLSSIFIRPSPPRLSYLTQQGGRGVVVHWCAPTSIVTHYNVRVKGNDKGVEVDGKKREVELEDVKADAIVCVEAVNKAGVSEEVDESCAIFKHQHSDSGLALKLGIIGGVVALILLLILALLLWRHRKRQKYTARTETDGAL